MAVVPPGGLLQSLNGSINGHEETQGAWQTRIVSQNRIDAPKPHEASHLRQRTVHGTHPSGSNRFEDCAVGLQREHLLVAAPALAAQTRVDFHPRAVQVLIQNVERRGGFWSGNAAVPD